MARYSRQLVHIRECYENIGSGKVIIEWYDNKAPPSCAHRNRREIEGKDAMTIMVSIRV